jgi:hypothetical protein
MRAPEAFFYFTSDVIALNGAACSLGGPDLSAAAAILTERYLAAIGALGNKNRGIHVAC